MIEQDFFHINIFKSLPFKITPIILFNIWQLLSLIALFEIGRYIKIFIFDLTPAFLETIQTEKSLLS